MTLPIRMGRLLPAMLLLGPVCVALVSCNDEIRPLQSARSAAGDVEATYVEVLYGGAAGGVTYCVNLHYADKKEDCVIAAIHINKGAIRWLGRKLIYTYCGGTITNNESGIRRANGVPTFEVQAQQGC